QGTDDLFFVKGPQVLKTPPSSPYHQHVERRSYAIGQLDTLGNLCSGTLPLNPRRDDEHLDSRPAPAEDFQEVANRCARGAGNESNSARKTGEGPFTFRFEEAFGRQLFAKLP